MPHDFPAWSAVFYYFGHETNTTIVNAFNQHPGRAFRARELHELLGMPTDEATVNVIRSRLGRLTRQGFLIQPARGRYQKRTQHPL